MEKFKSLSKENTYEVEQKILKEWQNINILEKTIKQKELKTW